MSKELKEAQVDLVEENKELIEYLRKYGSCWPECDKYIGKECSCGWEMAWVKYVKRD